MSAINPATNKNANIGHSSCVSWVIELPFNKIPRTMRRKCVRGKTSPMYCAHTGMARNGNMNPDKRIDGKKKKKVICIACN